MKMYILDNGHMSCDKNHIVSGAVIASRDRPKTDTVWIMLPQACFLFETSQGHILYDTGAHPEAMNGYWPTAKQNQLPMSQMPEQRLENQLALCGMKPSDITTVVLSHLHMDHVGNLRLFTHADVYVPKEEFLHAQAHVRLERDAPNYGSYIKADLDVSVKKFHLVEGDVDLELVPGLRLLNLRGHTPGLLGVMAGLDCGTFLLVQDAAYCRENYQNPGNTPGRTYDSLAYNASLRKIKMLEQKHRATVVFGHDEKQFATLKKTPNYYA